MAKRKSPKIEPMPDIRPVERPLGSPTVVKYIWTFGIATLALSVLAMFAPSLRLWAVHQFAFLHLAAALPLLVLAGVLLSPYGPIVVEHSVLKKVRLQPYQLAGLLFAVFMLLSVHGNLLGDGQLATTRLAHIGDMIESKEKIPPGRFFSQKEPGTMLLHEGAFRIGMTLFGPKIQVEKGRAGQQARVERQLKYREIAQWCFRILSSIAGVLLILLLLRFVRSRPEHEPTIFWLVMLTCGGWLAYFGYVENYAWVSLAMMAFLIAGVKATEPPRKLPVAPVFLFLVAVALHYMAVVLLPALVYLLWTMHLEPHDREQQNFAAPWKRAKYVAAGFATLGLIGYIAVEGWEGWISVIPLLPMWTDDGYAFFSVRHFVDIVNLAWWACGAALIGLLFTAKRGGDLRAQNQENFLLLAASSGAFFAMVFSPNLGMARDWDIVTSALWPTVFFAAWRLSQFNFDSLLPKLRASLAAVIVLILIPAVLVQTVETTAIARFENLLHLDKSRSAYGWENMALYYQKTGEIEKRVAAWEKAVEAEENPRYVYNLSEAYKLAGRIDDADSAAVRAAHLDKKFASNLFYVATAQAKRDNLPRAREIVFTALAIDSTLEYGATMKTWITRACLVDSVAKTGDTLRARSLLQFYAREDPKNSFWNEYGQKLGK